MCHAAFSPACPPDNLRGTWAAQLCTPCAAQLVPYAGACCPLCGIAYADATSPSVPCGQCLARKPLWTQLAFHGLYSGLLQSLLLRLKYRQDFSLVPVLGNMLVQLYAGMSPCQLVLAVPQHPSHLRERGFNQAHELARVFACQTGLPLAAEALTRTRPTLPQTQLSARERQNNPKDSFTARHVENIHVVLVDDTMTTGSTLHHATRALLQGGAASVSVAVVARTPPPHGAGTVKAHDNCRIFI